MLLIVVVVLSGCSPSIYSVLFDMNLSNVEHPAESNSQYGDTEIVTYEEDSQVKYTYEDDYIKIIWGVYREQFGFVLYNKTNYTMKLLWDEASYIDYNGKSSRVIHSGIKYAERNAAQAPSVIAKGAYIRDIVAPSDNISYEKRYSLTSSYYEWEQRALIPSFASTTETLLEDCPRYIGKKVSVIMPIKIEDTVNEYVFTFDVVGFEPVGWKIKEEKKEVKKDTSWDDDDWD